MPIYDSEKGKPQMLNEADYTLFCCSCGDSRDIQLWPHRNGHGQMVGFLCLCKDCKAVAPNITTVFRGIRGHDKNDLPECYSLDPDEIITADCMGFGHFMCKECTKYKPDVSD